MILTQRLLGYLNRVFNKDPKPFGAIRLLHASPFTWTVENATLRLDVDGGASLSFDLGAYTVAGLFQAINGTSGFTASVADVTRAGLSARVLLDGSGASGGEQVMLNGYTSLLWAWLEAVAAELVEMRQQIANMLLQLNVNTGEGVWLDEIGGYYGVSRLPGEGDRVYGPRIIAETLRARSNNVALEMAIADFTGQDAKVVDVTLYGDIFPLRNGAITRNGAEVHDSGAVPLYGLFDVVYAYDLEGGGDIAGFQQRIRALLERLRAAGTHLRALALQSSQMADTADVGTDAMALAAGMAATDDAGVGADDLSVLAVAMPGLADACAAGADDSLMSYDVVLFRNSRATRNGLMIHSHNATVSSTLEGGSRTIVPAWP